ncbi:MAG: hypothetical protein HOC71_02905 [Candidatus Latescibacteria bacterium]|nr:hypothetical protein [Candidatus Latescibacterota bacterium]
MLVDIHSHILNGVDDGPESFEMAMEMVRFACETGIRVVVATPHILDNQNEELVISRFRKLSEAIIDEKLPIDLFLGSEINFQFGINEILDTSIGTYRGIGRYFLVETTLTHYPKHFDETLFELQTNGRIPIFAHPERVGPIVGNSDLVEYLVAQGILVQVNSGSLLGMFGKRVHDFAWKLIEKGLVHFIASDAHNMRRRSFNLDAAWNEVYKLYGEETAEKLFCNNPLRMIFSENVESVKPVK